MEYGFRHPYQTGHCILAVHALHRHTGRRKVSHFASSCFSRCAEDAPLEPLGSGAALPALQRPTAANPLPVDARPALGAARLTQQQRQQAAAAARAGSQGAPGAQPAQPAGAPPAADFHQQASTPLRAVGSMAVQFSGPAPACGGCAAQSQCQSSRTAPPSSSLPERVRALQDPTWAAPSARSPQRALLQGVSAMEQGQWDAAVAAFTKALHAAADQRRPTGQSAQYLAAVRLVKESTVAPRLERARLTRYAAALNGLEERHRLALAQSAATKNMDVGNFRFDPSSTHTRSPCLIDSSFHNMPLQSDSSYLGRRPARFGSEAVSCQYNTYIFVRR